MILNAYILIVYPIARPLPISRRTPQKIVGFPHWAVQGIHPGLVSLYVCLPHFMIVI